MRERFVLLNRISQQLNLLRLLQPRYRVRISVAKLRPPKCRNDKLCT